MSVQKLRIRTKNGPVGLREKRSQPQTITVPGEAEQKMILAQWLKTTSDERKYHLCIKQAMMIGARYMDLNDAMEPGSAKLEETEVYKAKLRALEQGQERIQTTGHKRVTMKAIEKRDMRERSILIKYSKRCCCDRRERSFLIDNGELVIYKSMSKNAKMCHPAWKMKDALVTFETRMAGTYPKPRFEEGYTDRIKVVFDERKKFNKSPFYLYPKDKEQLKNWKRAFQLARVLVSENDRRVLKISLGRCTSASLVKGWEAMIYYFKEIWETRRLVKQMALRLMKVEYSRGWSKLKLVNQKIIDDKKRRQEQQRWAARFMSEKLARIGTQNAKKAGDVRETIITRIQQRFRHYRDEKIFDRQYPIGSKLVSRMRQARQGCQMDVALDMLTCKEVLKMTLSDPESLKKLTYDEFLVTKKSTYSEVSIPAAEMLLSVSDNLQSLAFTAPTHTTDAWSHLTKSDWSNFVNLDRISQVVLHSAPHLAIKRKDTVSKGVWCTVYGPKVAWGKRIDIIENKAGKEIDSRSVGVVGQSGFDVPKAVGQPFKGANQVRLVTVRVTVGEATWNLEDGKPPSANPIQRKILERHIALHIMGYRFTSRPNTDEASRTYQFGNTNSTVQAGPIPVAANDFALVCLDNSVLGVEITEVSQAPKNPSAREEPPKETKVILTGTESLWNIFKPQEGEYLQSYTKPIEYELLLAPPELQEGAKALGKLKVSIQIAVQNDSQARNQLPVSPELVGAGILTSLYTSHRGAWHDNELGPGQFRLDHVANFVELSLSGFRFDPRDKAPEDNKTYSYRVRATLCGITTETQALHRPRTNWSLVLGPQFGDSNVIRFNGMRMSLPLPPGCWGSSKEGRRPIVQIEIMQTEHEDVQPLTYKEFEASVGRDRMTYKQPVAVYRTALSFDGCVVDQVKPVSAFFAKGTKAEDAVICDVWTNQVKKGKATEAVLNLDFALRDRDYIKSSIGNQDHPPSDYKTICVGDKALLVWAEPILYPSSKQEFRSRFVPGTFKQGTEKWPADKNRDRGAPLRDPCVSSEYASSGLADMVPRVPFKQSIIPNYCTDIIPHKFVLPFTESQFLQDRRPGVYPWIVEDLAQKAQETGQIARGSKPPLVQVTHLKHTTRKVPVLLLATYPDGTADVEVAAEFMEEWKRDPGRRYSLPGKLLKMQPPTPKPKVPQAKDAPQPEEPPMRAILQKCPLHSLIAVHSAGFHVYDAEHKTTADVLEKPLRIRGFNPRDANSSDVTLEDLESFSITAGPMPADASPAACQYEWCLHVRAQNEHEMHKFVAMLRQCVRVDHYQQAARMAAYQSKQGEAPAIPQQFQRQAVGGQLEVVLVEARRLKAWEGYSSMRDVWTSGISAVMSMDSKVHEAKKMIPYSAAQQGPIHENGLKALAGTTSGENSKSTPEGPDMKTFVNFSMRSGNDKIAYKGQLVQSSEAVAGTASPSWANLEQLSASGGWTFKTGLIDPAKLNDLVIEFEVKQFSMGLTQRIGVIQLGVNAKPNLIDPKNPFRNLWVPLLHEPEEGVVQLHKTGEIHILTRWLPTEKLYLPPGQQQVTVRSQFLKEMWPKICAQRLKEPIYHLECQYLSYNPNLVRAKPPETPSHYVQRNTEDLHSTVPYLDCLDRRQNKEWKKFEDELAEKGFAGQKLGELRVKWVAEMHIPGHGHLHKLQELIEGGISCNRRERLWLDLTMASRVMEREGIGEPRDPNAADPLANRRAAEKDYFRQLNIGLPQRSDANMQLQEDAFHLSAWESTTPPIAEFLDFHLRRLKAAQNVCTALIAYERSGVAYCESLLIIAFFLLLPQGCTDQETNAEGEPQMYPMSESSAFWLLYTLVGTRVNGTFKEYYGRPDPVQPNPDEPARESLCVTSGAMHDVSLLECCLAYNCYDLWCHLNKLGFQLATVFYSAFMRLYATFMPTATVFRFWDILFSQSAHPKADPSGRSYLVDLAFGLLRAKRAEIMQCESALEVRTLILGLFGALYDSSTVVEITLNAHKFLWEGGFSGGKIGHLWTQREELFRHQNDAFQEQNDILKILTHERPLGRIPLSKYESPPNTKGVMTKELLKDVLPAMQNAFETLRPNTRGQGRHWAMHRPMPLAIKALAENSVEKAWNHMAIAMQGGKLIPIPELVGPPEDPKSAAKAYPGMEPLDITAADMATVLGKDIPNWAQCGQHLWKSFTNRRDLYLHYRPNDQVLGNANTNPTFMDYLFGDRQKIELEQQKRAYKDVEERISLNELFIALICCSRGTLGDKASCLFNLYSYVDQRTAPIHIQPIARLAKSITKTNEGSGEHMGKNLTPPEEDLMRNNVLHLQIKSNYPQKNTLVGEVFVPTLGPFVGYNPNEAEATSYNIWGPNSGNQSRFLGANNSNQSHSNKQADPHVVGGDKVVVGDLEMALTWTPASIKRPEEGQLCIRLRSIRFYKMYVSEYFKMNPRVEVYTYKKIRKEVPMQKENMQAHRIDRWDPRHLYGTSNQISYLQAGAYGGHIDFDPTMKEGLLGHGEHFRHWFRHGGDMGFHPDLEAWVWNETWGKQFSVENFVVEKEFMALSQRKNVMDIHGVRNIVTGILNRSMLNCTNRQALLIADTLFNRQGAVPGILEAVLVGVHPDAGDLEKWKGPLSTLGPHPDLSLKKMKEDWTKNRTSFTDVTNQLVIEHERQVSRFGFMNLFQTQFLQDWHRQKKKMITLDDMGMKGSAPGGAKTLWVRYVRSGDGERCTQGVLFESNGSLSMDKINPEVQLDLKDCWPQTKVTKEEFISCMLNSSLLGESIRRIGATDHTLHQRKSIPLDVTIMDPHQEETDQLLSDAINIGQSIVLEVWDADVASKDFLGECWLPPLAQLSSVPKDYVFQLKNADMTEDAENGPSRESKHKDLPEDQKITGELYVKLAWKYPAYEMNASGEGIQDKDGKGGEDVKDRAQIQEKLNTGRLTLQIIRAHHLRRADAAKGRDCDPQVTAYVRNDVLGQFRKKPLGRTGVVRNNRNPKWQGEFKDSPFDIMNGTYEARFSKKEAEGWFEEMKMALRGPMARRHQREDREMEAIKRYGTEGLKMKFIDAAEVQTNAAGAKGEGSNHKVEIYLGDTIREFKMKLSQACDQEYEHWARESKNDVAQKYMDVKISFKHLVMVFVPSPKVQRLYAQKLHEGAEYKHAYTLAIQDPSSWQPLDPTRTFGQYPQYGFGRKQPQLLRIVESSESYKLVNLRYKEFVKDQSKPLYQDTNTEERCYGWAKYWHENDIGPTVQIPGVVGVKSKTRDFEWRQAFIYKGSAAGTNPADMKYKVEWIFKPAKDSEKRPEKGGDERGFIEVAKHDVIMAPRCPLVDSYVDADHVEFLEQAKTYRQIGKSDWEIEVILNKSLTDKYGSPPENKEMQPPKRIPNITADIIRNYLQRSDAANASKAAGTAPDTKAVPKGNQPPPKTPQGNTSRR